MFDTSACADCSANALAILQCLLQGCQSNVVDTTASLCVPMLKTGPSDFCASCRYVRCLHLPHNAPPKLLAIAPGPGILLAHSWQSLAIHAYTINGRHIVSAEGIEQLNAFAVSADGRFVLTGGAKGVINLRWIHSLQVCCLFEAHITHMQPQCHDSMHCDTNA